jgi:hypothetical protein
VNYSTLSAPGAPEVAVGSDPELRELFHRLNNQLGVILAHGELLEAKAVDAGQAARASQVVASALEAMALTRAIRARSDV